jgi:hypothetical protein
MTGCSCKLKSGERKGQRCNAKVTAGRFCGRHANCADVLQMQSSQVQKSKQVKPGKPVKAAKKNPRFHEIIFTMKYQRNNDETAERDPTLQELDRYVSTSDIIPSNIDYMNELQETSNVDYIGKRQFRFTCETDLKPKEIADLFFLQSLADGEWGASPGDGSFVYPTKDGEELGLLSFESVVIDGKKFMSLH